MPCCVELSFKRVKRAVTVTLLVTLFEVRSSVDRTEKEPTQQSRLSRSAGDAGARGGASHPRTGAAPAASPKLDRRTFLGEHTWPHITLPPAGNVWSITIHDFGKQWVEMSWGRLDPIQGKRGEKGASRNRKMNEARARGRAKSTIRKKCLTIGADHLVTLTYRANVEDRERVLHDLGAYSDEVGHRFRANPATPRSPATQGLSGLS